MRSRLADDVLPLVRSAGDLHRYQAANEHGSQMHEAVGILEEAMGVEDPAVVHDVCQRALMSSLRIIMRADDSAGIIGDACRRLIALHPVTAAAAQVPPAKLVAWMMKFQFDEDCDYFELNPVAYTLIREEPRISASEWLSRWHETADQLERMQRDFIDPGSPVGMTDVEAAHLAGEIAMLNRVLQSRKLGHRS